MLFGLVNFAKGIFKNQGAALEQRPALWGSILALIVIIIAFWPFLIGKSIYFGDNFSLMVPGKMFTSSWLLEGILPLWNPYLFAGIPWIGDINQSILYPSTLFFALFPAGLALNITVILHIFSAWLGTFLLVYKLTGHKGSAAVSAMLFAFSTQLTGSINNIATLQSLSYMPWVVWSTLPQQKPLARFTGGVLAIGMQILAGYPQHVLYTLGFAAVLSLLENGFKIKTWFIYWLTVVLMSLGITTVVWFPFLAVMEKSTRATQSLSQATVGSLHPLELIKMIIPSFFDYPRGGMKWGLSWNHPPNVSLYFTWMIGIVGYWFLRSTRLKEISLRFYVLIGISALGIILALGKYVPGYELLTQIPILGATRGPSTALMLPALAGSLLLGELLVSVKVPTQWKFWSKALFGLGIFLLICLTVFFFIFPQLWQFADSLLSHRLSASTFHTVERDFVIARVILTVLTVNSLASAAALMLWKYKRWGFLALIIGLDMLINVQGHYQFSKSSTYNPEFISDQGGFFVMNSASSRTLIRNYNAPYSGFDSFWHASVVRAPFSDSYISTGQDPEMEEHLTNLRYGITPDWNQVAKIPTINGFTTLLPQDVHDRFGKDEDPRLNNLPEISATNPLLKEWSLRWYLVDRFYPLYEGEPSFPMVAKNDRWTLYELPYLSRFRYENGERAVYSDYTENPNKFEITVYNNNNHQWFILADRYDQAWKATVNNIEVEISNSNGMRAIPLISGENVISMKYQPWQWQVGLQISLVSFAGFLFAWLVWHKKDRLNHNKLKSTDI